MKQRHVLVVDDEQEVRDLVRKNLEKRGFRVSEAENGSEALVLYKSTAPDLLLLDIIMPETDGLAVCRHIRRSDTSTPIIVLSSQKEEDDKVEALNLGADDYIIKPFGAKELIARINAMIRRANPGIEQQVRLTIGDFVMDHEARRVFVDGTDIRLTRTEFALLSELAANLDSIVTHDELLARVWGPEYRGSTHYLHVYLGRVRKKMGDKHSVLLETVSGMGYVLHASLPTENP